MMEILLFLGSSFYNCGRDKPINNWPYYPLPGKWLCSLCKMGIGDLALLATVGLYLLYSDSP